MLFFLLLPGKLLPKNVSKIILLNSWLRKKCSVSTGKLGSTWDRDLSCIYHFLPVVPSLRSPRASVVFCRRKQKLGRNGLWKIEAGCYYEYRFNRGMAQGCHVWHLERAQREKVCKSLLPIQPQRDEIDPFFPVDNRSSKLFLSSTDVRNGWETDC